MNSDLIELLMNSPVGSDLLYEIFPGIKILPYSDIISMYELNPSTVLEQMLDNPFEACIILYQTGEKLINGVLSINGHWVCLFKRNKKTLSFFDSYGIKPDMQLQIPSAVHVAHTYMLRVIYDSEYNLEYNDALLQGPTTSTCGRHVIVRLKHRRMSPDKFIDWIFKKCNAKWILPDEFVVRETIAYR